MARPKQGYFNAAGQPIPATGDINGRFMDRSRLLYWAFNRGKQGCAKLYENDALDIGSCVHTMAELDLKGAEDDRIMFYARTTLTDPEQLEKALISFRAFRQWRAEFHVEAYVQEASLVSERYQFGGTLDTIAIIRGGRGLLEFKTSAEVYEDHLMQMAAYSILWEETHPDEPLTAGYHLILLPKDGSKPIHREYTREQIEPYRAKFLLYRQAFDLDVICNSSKMLKGISIVASVKPETPAKPASKPRVRVSARSAPMSMGELLRAYGHVKEGVRA
jgi:hypothetical protein